MKSVLLVLLGATLATLVLTKIKKPLRVSTSDKADNVIDLLTRLPRG